MNKTIDLINKRSSVRKFNDVPIDTSDMDVIINSALRAPTAGNMMMYSIIKIKNKETLEKLSISCDNQPFIKDADTALIFVADLSKWHDYFLENGIKEFAEKTGRVYESPSIADLMLGVNDALIAAQNSVIAAESLNIGSCYIGDILENFEYHKELLNLPNYSFPATMLVFGNYDNYPTKKPRFKKEYVVFEEEYGSVSTKDMFKEKDDNYKANEKFDNYAQAFYNRKIGSDFFEEMNRSIKVILKEWL